jgi:hypothetical protein
MYSTGHHVKNPYSGQIFVKLVFSRQIEKKCNRQISRKSLQWSRVVPRRGTVRRTDMAKLIVAFRNFSTRLKFVSRKPRTRLHNFLAVRLVCQDPSFGIQL